MPDDDYGRSFLPPGFMSLIAEPGPTVPTLLSSPAIVSHENRAATATVNDPSVERGDSYYAEIRKALRSHPTRTDDRALSEEERDRKWMRETLHGKN